MPDPDHPGPLCVGIDLNRSKDRGVILRKNTGLLQPWLTLAVAVLFAVLAVFMTWPLALEMDRAVIGWVGDNYLYVWMIGWFQKALLELHRSPLFVPILNYPQGFDLAYTDIPFTMVLIGLPASLVSTPTLGYNVSIFVSFVLSGLGVYLWVRRLTGSVPAGVIAGTLFAFVPYRMSHLLGHLNLMGTQWFPFYFMGLSDLIDGRKRPSRAIVLASISLALIGFTSQYYLYMTLILSVAYVVGYLLFDRRSISRSGTWKRLGAFAIAAGPLVALAVMPYLALAGQERLTHSFEPVRMWSASPTDFVLPSPEHFVWGEWIAQHFDRRLWIENTLYVGAIPGFFTILAVLRRKKALPQGTTLIKVLFSTAAIAFILALGTDFHWLGQSVRVGVPGFARRWYPFPQVAVPLPGYFLFRFLPFYAGMRVWMRYGIFVSLFASVLAGIGIAWLLGRIRRPFVVPVSTAILLLALIDFYPGIQSLSAVDVRPVDAWLSDQGAGAVAQFPFWQIKGSRLAYATLIHDKPLIGDPFGTFHTVQFQQIQPVLSSFPDPDSVALLKELGVRWVIVDSTQYPDVAQVQAAIESLGLQFRIVLDGQYVYELEGS
jgi:hypothetical protein